MDVYVEGYEYSQKLDKLLDLMHYIENKLNYNLFNKILSPEKIKQLHSIGGYPQFEPDGMDGFEPTGTINLYVKDFPQDQLDKVVSAAQYFFGDIGVDVDVRAETYRDSQGIAYDGTNPQPDDVRVIRLIVKNNPHFGKDKNPPSLNMSNRNARMIFEQLLNFNMSDTGGTFDVWQVLDRIDKLIPYRMEEFERDTSVSQEPGKATMIDIGVSTDYMQERIGQVKEIAEWARDNGYSKIGVY